MSDKDTGWLRRMVETYERKHESPWPREGDPNIEWQRARFDGHTEDDFVHVWVVWHPEHGIHGIYTSGDMADAIEDKLPVVGEPYRIEKHRLQGWLLRTSS